MKIQDITEDLSDLFGRGSDIGKVYNPGMDPEVAAAQAARSGGGAQFARPTQSGAAQADWDANMAKYFNPDGTPRAQTSGKGSVGYVSDYKGRTRNKPVKPALMNVLKRAAESTGFRVVIFSGGQDVRGKGTRRTGTTRHDAGNAADVWVYAGQEQLRTDGNDPRMINFIAALRRAGAKGFGAHPGYMKGVGVHVDIVGTATGGSNMWGAGGTGSPPTSLARAFTTGKGTGVA